MRRGAPWYMRGVAIPLVFVGLLLLPGEALAGDHIRVILDTSKSMRGTDKDQLAKLATLLLYDLADPNLSKPGNTFKVYPFAGFKKWKARDPRPPQSVKPIDPETGGNTAADHRRSLQKELQNLKYDGRYTYFYPGLKLALDELKRTTGGTRDRRVIVIVTDGLPETDTKGDELAYIRKHLLPDMVAANIQLFVLAFGKEAYSNQDFFDQLIKVSGPNGTSSLGQNKVDPDGQQLLQSMIDIFTWCFGYEQVSQAQPMTTLDLTGGKPHSPDRALVVAYSDRPRPPRLQLDDPSGDPPDLLPPRHLPRAKHRDGFLGQRVGAKDSYTLQKVLNPQPGPHGVSYEKSAKLAVLLPVNLALTVRHLPSEKKGKPVPRVMAGKNLDLNVDVRLAGNVSGRVPGGVNVHFQVHAGSHTPGTPGYRQSEAETTSRAPPTTVSGDLRYDITPLFSLDPEPDEPFYTAYVEVWAIRNHATVGQLTASSAFPVHVYPKLSLVPNPTEAGARPAGSLTSATDALSRNDRGCATFIFHIGGATPGQMPHLVGGSSYSLRAVLDKDVTLTGALNGAGFTLDGDPLRGENFQGPAPGRWFNGANLTEAELEKKHTVCARLGKPSQGDPAVEVPIRFTLNEPPYDVFQVVKPFALKVNVARPGLYQRLGPWVFLSLLLLGLAALLWYLRRRPDLPPDMNAGVRRRPDSEAPTTLVSVKLGEPSPLRRWLGLPVNYPLFAETGTLLLGRVVPVDDALYRFRPGDGVVVYTAAEDEERGPEGLTQVVLEDGQALLEVRTVYVARISGKSFNFWVAYK